MLPNFLCYEMGPVKLALSLKETIASYRWNVDPADQPDESVLLCIRGGKGRDRELKTVSGY